MDRKVDQYIGKQHSPQKEICLQLRQLIFTNFPDIREEMKWGVPSYDNGKYYIVALKNHVNLGFLLKGLSKEEIGLFDGGGKTMKHIKVNSVEGIDKERISKLLRLVKSK